MLLLLLGQRGWLYDAASCAHRLSNYFHLPAPTCLQNTREAGAAAASAPPPTAAPASAAWQSRLSAAALAAAPLALLLLAA